MDLDRSAREYVSADLTGLPADYTSGLEVTIDGGITWHPVDVVTVDGVKKARTLFAGPAATGNPPGTVVLPVWGSTYRLNYRLTDNPEVIIRGGGTIYVT